MAAAAVPAGAVCLDWPIGADQVPGKYITIEQDYANRGGFNWYDNRPHAGSDLQYPVWAPERAARRGGPAGHPRPADRHDPLLADRRQRPERRERGEQVEFPRPLRSRDFLFDPINGTAWGPGYGSASLEPYQQGWFDPVQAVFNERSFPETVFLTTSRNVRSQAYINSSFLGTAASGNYTLEGIESGATATYPWWHRVRYNGVDLGYVNSIQDWGWGSLVLFGHAGGCAGGGGGGPTVDDAIAGFGSVPGSLVVNQSQPVTVTVTNTGTSTWHVSEPVRLAAAPSTGMESGSSSQFGWISNWGPSGGWAFHSGFPAGNNGSLGARFGFYSAGTSETVGQVLGERFSAFTTYTFKSRAIGGGNRQGVVPYQIGYAAIDNDLSSFQLLASTPVNLNGNQSWIATSGVSYTTGGSGAALGKQIIVRFGNSSAGGQSDIWFDGVTVTRQ